MPTTRNALLGEVRVALDTLLADDEVRTRYGDLLRSLQIVTNDFAAPPQGIPRALLEVSRVGLERLREVVRKERENAAERFQQTIDLESQLEDLLIAISGRLGETP